MGILQELLKKKVQDNITNKYTKDNDKEDVEEIHFNKYNQTWLLNVTRQTGYIINNDRDKAQKILEALNRREGHCPCGGDGKQYLCPCLNMRTYGICKCGLFENVQPVNPTGKSTMRIKER